MASPYDYIMQSLKIMFITNFYTLGKCLDRSENNKAWIFTYNTVSLCKSQFIGRKRSP